MTMVSHIEPIMGCMITDIPTIQIAWWILFAKTLEDILLETAHSILRKTGGGGELLVGFQ